MLTKLTKRQKEILDYITKCIKENDYAPSLEEIKRYFKLSSVSTIHQHIEAIREKGYLKKIENQPRSIEINNKKERSDLVEIPLLGTIAAGAPIEAIEFPETITLPKSDIPKSDNYYSLRVKGDSMIDEGIFDNDIVIIKKQSVAENGQTVIAIIDDNEATLKKIYREKNRFRLQPANQSMLPLYRKQVEIRGIVVKIIRQLESIYNNDSELIKIIKSMPPTINAHRIASSSPDKKAKPFMQWVGGKRETISQYEKLIPKKFNTYFEPFLGGGAMFFHLQPKKAVLADNNKELIRTYEGVRDNPEKVIKILTELKSKHSKDLYTKIRNLDREIDIFYKLDNAEIAARMIYLNQTCFNGLYRVNKLSQFNVPIGSSLNRLICDKHTIRNVSKALAKISIQEKDFITITRKAKKDDFVYLDPPYYPVSTYSDFTRYTKEKFYKEDQIRLKKEIDRLSKIGCRIMLSNSDCEFIRDLYSNYNINEVRSSRSLNCKKNKRGKVSELLITNY